MLYGVAQCVAQRKSLSLCGQAVAVQAFGLKSELQKDFSGTLRRVAEMGYREVELCSFKGFAGDALRGDFGKLSNMEAVEVRTALADAGLAVRSCQFKPEELEESQVDATLEWADTLGIKYFALLDVYFAGQEWQPTFDRLNDFGERLRTHGLQLALHTGNDFWTRSKKETAFDAFLREVTPEHCSIELDLSATLLNGIDAGECMSSHPDRFCAVHLRDGKKPVEQARWIPSLPLGEGEIDFTSVLSGAQKAGVTNYIVEMAVFPPVDPIEALQKSAEFIRSLSG